MCSKAPDQGNHLCESTHLGLQGPQAKDSPKEAPRARASRHKLTCRKKTVVTATARLLRPPTSASRPSAKRSRPAASSKQEGTGTLSRVASPDCSAANKAAQTRQQKVSAQDKNAAAKASAHSGLGTRQKGANQAAPTKTKTEQSARSLKKQKIEVPDEVLPVPDACKEHTHVPGHEPYRALGLVVHEHEILDAQSLKNMARAKAQYNKKYREARVTEDARYAATGGKDPATGKNLSRRPDTLARKLMDAAQESINRQPVAGHVPGIAISDRSHTLAW
ncbi:hypothetical protein ABBQ32_007271 [Trebouxia sp. C0010 RCD-2024]